MDYRDRMIIKNMETKGEYNAKVSGDYGEYSISSVMHSLPDYYHILNDVLLKTKKGTTQIDHVIVSPFGIFVIETKNHKGMIFGDCFGKVWTQVLRGKGRYTFYSPVKQNEGHIRCLSRSIKIPTNCIMGIIVFTNEEVNLGNVNCPFCYRIQGLYDVILSFQNIIFSERQVDKIIDRIDKVNISGYKNSKKHVEYVKGFKERAEMRKRMRGY